jgi:hypothetical protein
MFLFGEHVKNEVTQMSVLNITEAAKAANVSRSYLYKLKAKGGISFTEDNGNPGVDTSEILRVFGRLHQIKTPEQLELESLQLTERVAGMRDTLAAKDSHINTLTDLNEVLKRQVIELEARLHESRQGLLPTIKRLIGH